MESLRLRVENLWPLVAALGGEGRLLREQGRLRRLTAGCRRVRQPEALSCTAAADTQVAGSLMPSAGSRERGQGAVDEESADPARPLLRTRPELEGKSGICLNFCLYRPLSTISVSALALRWQCFCRRSRLWLRTPSIRVPRTRAMNEKRKGGPNHAL